MAYTIKKNIKVYIKEESTPFTYEAPTATDDAIKVKTDGLELTPSKELLEKDEIGQGLSSAKSGTGLEGVTGSLNAYMKAHGTEGTVPEYGVLVESLFGTKQVAATQVTDNTSQASTASRLEFNAAPNFKVGDSLLVKVAATFEVRPVTVVGADYVELAYALTGAPGDATSIAAVTTFVPADSGHPSYSVTKYIEDAVAEKATGCMTSSMTLSSWSVGQYAGLDFAVEGIDFDREFEVPDSGILPPSFDTANTPVILGACVVQDGVTLEVNEFTLSIENTLAPITDTCNGKTGIRVTDRKVSGSFNPKKLTDSLTQYTNFDQNLNYELHIIAKVPTATGEFKDTIAFWIPMANTVELAEGEVNNGLLTDAVSFQAFSVDGTTKEIYMSTI